MKLPAFVPVIEKILKKEVREGRKLPLMQGNIKLDTYIHKLCIKVYNEGLLSETSSMDEIKTLLKTNGIIQV